MNKILFLILALILSACSSQVTVTSEVTVTLPPPTPLPTVVPTQTPEPLSQAFLDVQKKFAETDMYTLTPLAIKMKQEDETIKPIEGIVPNTKDGTFTITHEGEKFIVELESINEKVITFKGADGRIWILDGKNLIQPLSPELQQKFEELGAKQGKDENGNPIYFITNPAGETVIVGRMNEEENKWEKADAIKFQIFKSFEEAEASGEIMDTEYVLRGGPGQAAKLNGEPFPENVLTGLNIEVVKPNWLDPNSDQLNFDTNGISILKENPDQAPYRIAGYFLYKNILNGVEQSGYGYVWQWTNPDKSIVYITTITSLIPSSSYYLTPFANFNLTTDISSIAPILDKIGHDEEINSLMLQWAKTDVVPVELQDRALRISYRFK